MTSERDFSRKALTRNHFWSPRETFQSQRWTGAAVPVGIPVQHYNLFDPGSTVANSGGTGSFENRVAPWTYRFDGEPGSLTNVSGTYSLGGALRAEPEVLWMSDLVIHLRDAAGSGATMTLLIKGYSPTHQELAEEIKITTAGADTYVRTRFAYSRLTEVTILALAGWTNADYLEIGHDLENGAEDDVKIGLPIGIDSILDVTAVKADATPTGTNVAMPNNVRGVHAIDLVNDGAIFDRRDNAIRVNTCTQLTRPHVVNSAPATFTLQGSPVKSRHTVIFQIDPRNPKRISKPRKEVKVKWTA